jgi:release factor glutamine methyltransferase
MLAGYFESEGLAAGRSALDMCTGSGMLAIAAARAGASTVTAVDVSRRAVAAARLNGWANGVRVEALRGDLFSPVRGRRFDLIVSNPPYLPGDISELPKRGLARAWEGGQTGRIFIDRIAAQAADHLTDDGDLLLVCSTVCGETATLAALRAGGLIPSVAARHRGGLGPRLTARSDWLRQSGLLLPGDEEEILIVRARRAPVASRRPVSTRV